MKYLLTILTVVVLFSCTKDEAEVNYYNNMLTSCSDYKSLLLTSDMPTALKDSIQNTYWDFENTLPKRSISDDHNRNVELYFNYCNN